MQGVVAHIYNPSYSEGKDRKIMVRGQPGQNKCQTHLKTNQKQKEWGRGSSDRALASQGQSSELNTNIENSKQKNWIQWLTPVILATWEADIRRILVRGHPRQDPMTKITREKWTVGVAQEVVHLCEIKALSSNSSLQ
jgi:hypothetical protein